MNAILSVRNVMKIRGVRVVVVGNVRSGALACGMILNINGGVMPVGAIEMNHENVNEAHEGDNVSVLVNGADYGLLKSVIGQDVAFSSDGSVRTEVAPKPNPIHPKGFLGQLKGLFGK